MFNGPLVGKRTNQKSEHSMLRMHLKMLQLQTYNYNIQNVLDKREKIVLEKCKINNLDGKARFRVN